MSSELDVAVIGGGAAGVAAASRIAERRPDLEVCLFEAAPRLGGRARTHEAGPAKLPLDLGCGWLHGARDNAWAWIAEQRGFVLDDHLAPWDGAERDLGLGPAEEADAARAMNAFFSAAERRGTDGPDASLASLIEPGNRWNGLIGATATYINGVELERASIEDLNRYEPGEGPDRRVVAGYGRLVESYGSSLPVALNTAVTRVDHRGHKIVLSTTRGSCSARVVIVTVSTNVLASEGLRFDPAIPDTLDCAARLPLGLANKLFLSVPTEIDLPSDGYLLGSPYRVRTASYHVRPFGRPVIECYFGGDLARDLERDQKAAVAFAVEELSRFYGAVAAHRFTFLAASAWAAAPYVQGSYSYAVPGAALARERLAEPVDQRLFFAGEACAGPKFSTAHGAFEAGVSAADAALTALAG